jgi:chemotaxis protein CheD
MRHYILSVAQARIVQGPAILETVLGSCVSAVFWFAPQQLGAMCHGALPECPRSLLRSSDVSKALRYTDYAIYYLLDRLRGRGIKSADLEVKLFGGANLLGDHTPGQAIGRQNSETARRIVEKEGLRLMASDLGGMQGRLIYFRTDTGEVFLRRIHGHTE